MLTFDKMTDEERLSQSEEEFDTTEPRKRSESSTVAFPVDVLLGAGSTLDRSISLLILGRLHSHAPASKVSPCPDAVNSMVRYQTPCWKTPSPDNLNDTVFAESLM